MVATLVDVKIVLRGAIGMLSSGIILAHNHPSGNLAPSKADITLTQKIKDACKLIDTEVIDHLILIENGGYYSFADNGDI